MNFIVLSSSRGTTFQAVLDRIADDSLTARCLGLVTDRSDRGCIAKAASAGLPFSIVERIGDEDRDTYCHRLHEAILDLINQQKNKQQTFPSPQPDLTSDVSRLTSHVYLACMGWMWILTPWFIEQWPDRILNVHPALLPHYGGKGMYGHHVHEAVLAAGDRESGATIHLMDTGVDTGHILLQKRCPVLPGDTPQTLQQRVQELEKEAYLEVLQKIEEERI